MNEKSAEIIAVAASVVGCVYATIGPFFHEERVVQAAAPSGARIISLTGVASTGTWTEEDVNAANYWGGPFPPARPVLRSGTPVLFRLKSSDVLHSFYCPGLDIGPVEVYPGHVQEVLVTPGETGVYEYYCTTVCGDPHFAMRGEVVVAEEEMSPPPTESAFDERYWQEPPPPEAARRVERGEWLFRRMGCQSCHGPEGRGGIPNWNYVKDTVPALNTLAERLMLFEPEDAEVVVDAIEQGAALESLLDDSPIPRFNVVLAQYNSVLEVIRKGSPAGKKDPQGATPPLEMPPWGQRLSERDVESIVAYLLTLQPWEEEEDYEEEEEDDENGDDDDDDVEVEEDDDDAEDESEAEDER